MLGRRVFHRGSPVKAIGVIVIGLGIAGLLALASGCSGEWTVIPPSEAVEDPPASCRASCPLGVRSYYFDSPAPGLISSTHCSCRPYATIGLDGMSLQEDVRRWWWLIVLVAAAWLTYRISSLLFSERHP